ncbi:MAG: histidine phosphatase family protein [Paracoccaceae bacterium]
MAELMVVRHAQASFGADNYDKLSDLGHRQSALLGQYLRCAGWIPDRLVTGTLVRQQETLASMGFADAPETHHGFNEYDFHNLLSVRFNGDVPNAVMGERKTHFRTLRETILEWQRGGLDGADESWVTFETRVAEALKFATDTDARRVLVISSGGAIGQLVASVLGAPSPQMMELNLQMRNTSTTRFVFSARGIGLTEFNSLPHVTSDLASEMITYS